LSNAFFENLSVPFESCLPSFTIQLPFVTVTQQQIATLYGGLGNRQRPAIDGEL